jgi:hypothetical protein
VNRAFSARSEAVNIRGALPRLVVKQRRRRQTDMFAGIRITKVQDVQTRRKRTSAIRIEQLCEFEWSAISYFPESLSAHKFDRNVRPTGCIRPDHLPGKTVIYLKPRFNERA